LDRKVSDCVLSSI